MPRAKTNGIELEYDTFGDPSRPAMLLVMGFSLQMIAWDARFCDALASRGFFVVRFDNRDVGLSTKIEGARAPSFPALMMGDAASLPYTLDDMAKDTVGLLDALGLARAHVVGLSMGGMIAQLLAIGHAERVASLASIMSTTGDRAVGQPAPETMPVLFSPVPRGRDANIELGVTLWRILTSPKRPFDEERVRAQVARAYDRAFYPPGAARQLAAILGARDRTPELAKVRVPTVVIHGEDDPLIAPSGGEATARAIPGAVLEKVPAMGHELPPEHWPRIVDAIVSNATR